MKPKATEILGALFTLLLFLSSAPRLFGQMGGDRPSGGTIVKKEVRQEIREAKEEERAWRLLSSSGGTISVLFTLPLFSVEESPVEGFREIRCPGAVNMAGPGWPSMPYFQTRVAVPPEAEADVSVSLQGEASLGSLEILPVPRVIGRDEMGIPIYEYAYADSFLSGNAFPSPRFVVEGPHFMGSTRMVTITLAPFQVDPGSMAVSYLREARVDIRLRGEVPRGAPPAGGGLFDEVARSAVTNPLDARMWRKMKPQARGGLSPFAAGEDWVKIVVKEEGMYRITYSDLFELGVDPAMIDPAGFQVYYLGGRELPFDVTQARPELEEVATKVIGEEDGRFDSGDMIVFYGQSLSRWIAPDEYTSHRYTDENAYWLTWGNPQAVPRRMATRDASPTGASLTVREARRRAHFEQNTTYVASEEDGYLSVPDGWIWEEISGTQGIPEQASYSFSMTNLAGAGTDSLRMQIYGTPAFTSHKVLLSLNGRTLQEIRFSSRFSYTTSWIPLASGDLREGTNTLTVTLPKDESSVEEDAIYFGWFEISSLHRLEGIGESALFSGKSDTGRLAYVLEDVPGSASGLSLFDVTDPFSPAELMGFLAQGDSLVFEDESPAVPARYALASRARLLIPTSISLEGHLELREPGRGADYVIITARDLLAQAERLAQFRREENGFLVRVVTKEDVYSEFSGGVADVTAMRDFLAWAHENWDPAPQWALLFGDGHLDYKGYTTFGQNKPNPMPPHVENDLAIDDWFVRFDAGYEPDMFYGRVTVRDAAQAKIAVDRIIRYESHPEYGAWRSRVILIGDDCWRNKACETLPHTSQSEDVDARVSPQFKRVKVYLLDFPFEPPGTGTLKPAAREYLIEQWNRGAMLVNYVGHGSYNRWAHEKVFFAPTDMPFLKNEMRLPVVVAASCSIGHFDHFLYDAMVEDLTYLPDKGAIASFAATRVTYSDPNRDMNNAFVDTLFREPFTKPYVGVAAVKAKIAIPGGNGRRYTLFGDPATRLAFPDLAVRSVAEPDSFVPLAKTSYTAEVTDGGERQGSFQGYAQVDAYAPPRRRVADECTCIVTSWWDTGDPLYSGAVPVASGSLEASFIVPANIPMSLPADTQFTKNSRIYTYAWAGSGDAYGVVDSIPITGTAAESGDTVGPALVLLFLGAELAGGESVPRGAPLSVEIADPSGINLTGAPGFQILAEVDDGNALRQDVTEEFAYDVGSFTEGKFEFTVPEVPTGPHMFSFRATDNALNTGRTSVNLIVAEEGVLALENALLYPNPFRTSCTLTFDLNSPALVTVKIFTTGGRLIRRMTHSGTAGFNALTWDGKDGKGDLVANGAYMVKIIAKSLLPGGPGGEDEAMLKALCVK